jgi:crotonobetainyl-CoA:carnitine CoA-transferase CaiB-like acyl-CoA transferase
MSERQNSESLLAGYSVLDLTDDKGLLCGAVLGDLGTDVVKIEPPGGDPARNIGPFYKDIPHPEKSLFWFYTNLNKRGITLNLEVGEGREIFKELVAKADAVIESFEPGYLDSLGLGYSELEKVNPGIVMTSITPFGQKGPYAHFKATDLVGLSLGGMVRIFGEPNEPPCRISLPQFYYLGSLHAAAGTMMALYHRDLTGEGQWVDVACRDAVVKSLMIVSSFWELNRVNAKGIGGWIITPRPKPLGDLLTRRIWECKDGHVVLMLAGGAQPGMVASSRALAELANENGMAVELTDYDWRTWNAATMTQEEADRIFKPLADFLKTKSKAELFDEAVKRSILLAPVQHIGELIASPQLKERGFWVEVDHPELGGTITYPGFPMKISGLSYRPQRRAPLIGEHNEEIYMGELGRSKSELVLLKAQRVI